VSVLTDRIRLHRPADAVEAAHRDAILLFLGSGGDPFDRRRYIPGHLTGSAFVLDAARNHLLLLHHAKLDRWLQPGGHAEAGETDPLAVAMREAREETGIPATPISETPFDLDVHVIPARKDEPAHLHLDIRYLLKAPPGAGPRASAESKDIRWVAWADVGGDAGMLRAVEKIRIQSRA